MRGVSTSSITAAALKTLESPRRRHTSHSAAAPTINHSQVYPCQRIIRERGETSFAASSGNRG